MDYKSELSDLILTLVKEKASDLHLNVGSRPIIRVNGELLELMHKNILTAEDTTGFLKQLVNERVFNNFVVKQELDFPYEYANEYRLRGNAYFERGVIAVTMRLVLKPKTFEELNLPHVLSQLAHEKQGFFIVVGPVRQGKSTTLAAMINEINTTERKHIVTIEDPAEYLFTSDKSIVDQREVGMDTESFGIALREVFRQDVDVIMIGEMRDTNTISIAVTAAETGHLVLSTLHTNSAAQTVNRIIDSFPAEQQRQVRLQLAGSLLGIFSQRLLPDTSGGMLPAYELLLNDTAISNLIREDRVNEIDVMIETGSDKGMIDFDRYLAGLVREGKIAMDVALANARDPKVLRKLI